MNSGASALHIDPTLMSSVSALLGALVGGSASLVAAIYTQRVQHQLHRAGAEVAKREAVYAEFVMNASQLMLDARIREGFALGAEEHRLVGLINRMRLFAPADVLSSAETVLKAIVDVLLLPPVELRELAKEALAEGLRPDPLLSFSTLCRSDLDYVRGSSV